MHGIDLLAFYEMNGMNAMNGIEVPALDGMN